MRQDKNKIPHHFLPRLESKKSKCVKKEERKRSKRLNKRECWQQSSTEEKRWNNRRQKERSHTSHVNGGRNKKAPYSPLDKACWSSESDITPLLSLSTLGRKTRLDRIPTSSLHTIAADITSHRQKLHPSKRVSSPFVVHWESMELWLGHTLEAL